MKRFFVVESDCLGIVQRLKEIDGGYFLVFDIDKKKYELHDKSQMRNSYCLTFPFDQIDERMVDMAKKTRVQNSDALFEEMERENKRRQDQVISATMKTFKEKLYES